METALREKGSRSPLREVFVKFWRGTIVGVVLAGTAGAVFTTAIPTPRISPWR
jgi:hypothetical protein